jgi:branched-subunit amino acid transport protein
VKLALILVLGAITYASRAAGLALLPRARGRLEEILERLPAPIFAALAVVALVDDSGALISVRALVAVGFALVATPTRSLPVIFGAGLVGYLVTLLF